MNVLYLSPNGYLGGAERFVVEMATAHRSPFQPTILFFDEGPAVEIARSRNLDVLVLSSKPRLSRPSQFFKAVQEIRYWLRERKIDILHSTMPYSHLFASPASLGTSVKRVWFQHGPIGGRLDEAACLLPVEGLLFNSSYTRECHFRLRFGGLTRRAQSKVIPLSVFNESAVNEESLSALAIDLSGGFEAFGFLSLARFSPLKGQDVLVEAVRIFSKQSPQLYAKSQFLIVGSASSQSDREFRQRVVEAAKGLDRIQFLEFQKNTQSLFQSSRVYVSTSTSPEGFGLSIGEAMANGLLALTGKHGGLNDMVKDGLTGVQYDERDSSAPQHLARWFETLILNWEKEFVPILKRGQEHVRTNFNHEKMRQSVEAFYQSL